MYNDELADYLEDLVQGDREFMDELDPVDPAAQDAEEMKYEDWREHWVVDGELVSK